MPSSQSVGVAASSSAVARRLQQGRVTRARGRFRQVGSDEQPVGELVARERPLRRVAGQVVAPEPVPEHGRGVVGDVGHPAPLARRSDHLRRRPFLPAPGREPHRGVADRRAARRGGDPPFLVQRRLGRGQLAAQDVRAGDEVQRELQLHQRPVLTRDLDLAGGERVGGVGVGQLQRDRPGATEPREPEPLAEPAGRRLQRQHRVQRGAQRRRARHRAVGEPDGQPVEEQVLRLGAGRQTSRLFGRRADRVGIVGPDRRAQRLEIDHAIRGRRALLSSNRAASPYRR